MKINKIRSRLTDQLRKVSEAGDKFQKKYEMQIDDLGHKTLVCIGETNLYDKIQSHLEETKIENILIAASMGDMSALEKAQGRYLDCTEMPKTLAEAQNLMIKCETEFKELPVDIRAKFEHSVEKYITSYGSEEWLNAMGFATEEPKKIENLERKEEKEVE